MTSTSRARWAARQGRAQPRAPCKTLEGWLGRDIASVCTGGVTARAVGRGVRVPRRH